MLKPNQFIVEGRGEFPLDMLRRDHARPVSADSRRMTEATLEKNPELFEASEGTGYRRYQVVLETDLQAAPTTARWESFRFRVVEVGSGLFGMVSEDTRLNVQRHPVGTTGSQRAGMSDDRLREAGGVKRTLRLSAEALADLNTIRGHSRETSDRAVIERLLKREAAALRQPKKT